MAMFKVQSGDFVTVVNGTRGMTLRNAADAAIQLHDKQKNTSSLGIYTLIERLNRQGKPNGDFVFLCTTQLITDNTSGLGELDGQYTRIE